MPEQINGLNIPSLQNKRPVNFQQNQQQGNNQNTQQTSMQGTTAMQGVPQSVGDTQLGNRVKNSSDMAQSPYTLPVAAATWYAIAQGMDKFGEKCGGSYDESILGKITGKADKLSNKVSNSKIVKSSFGQWISNKYTNVANYLDRISNNPKNRILYSLRNHKTNPECKLVKVPAAGLDGFLEADTRQVFEEFLNPAKHAQQLKQYGIADDVVKSIEGLPKPDKYLRLQNEELKYFKEDPEKLAEAFNKLSKKDKIRTITAKMKEFGDKIDRRTLREYLKSSDDTLLNNFKELKLKELKITKGLGFDSIAHYNKVTAEDYALTHMDEIKNALRKGDQNLKIRIWKKDGKLGRLYGHLLGREIGIAELANKFDLSLKTGAKTKFGKFVGKAFGYLTEGCTNRFAGGKLAVAMQAFIFADMFIHAFKAPKGEKGKTLAERFVNDFTYFLALPLGIWGMHKAGGLKYLGMTNAQREAYRQNLKNFNLNHASYGKKMYKMRKKVLDRQLMAGVKNPFLKIIKKAANLLTVGLERRKTYVSKDKFNLNWLRKSKYFGNNALGYIIRFAIPMFMVSPWIAKVTTQMTHKIFGRPTNSVLDEDKEEPQAATNKNPESQQVNKPETVQPVPNQPTQNIKTANTPTRIKSPQEYASDTNLIKMHANGQKPRTYIPSPESKVAQSPQEKEKGKETEPVRTYIPSPVGMVQQAPDLSAADRALANADAAEQFVNETLKSIG